MIDNICPKSIVVSIIIIVFLRRRRRLRDSPLSFSFSK
jgi:hypothetical protein